MTGRRVRVFEGSREVDVRREEMGISVSWCREDDGDGDEMIG